MFHHVPDGGGVEPIGKIVELDRLCVLLLHRVAQGVAAVGHCFCENNHGASFSLVSTLDVMFSSMWRQCRTSPATASIHQRMNFVLLK